MHLWIRLATSCRPKHFSNHSGANQTLSLNTRGSLQTKGGDVGGRLTTRVWAIGEPDVPNKGAAYNV